MKEKNEPIRIAQIIGKWVGGGVEAVVMNYYRHINRTKIQFDFICDEDSTDIPYEEIESLGGRVILIPPYQRIFDYHKKLKQVFKENKYQIVHSHINTLSVFSLWAAWSAKVPVRIAHSHSTIVNDKKEFKRNIVKNILKNFSKLFATNYMCCSETAGITQFGKKTYKANKVFLLKNAIDLDKFHFNKKLRKDKRKQLGISENCFVIGHIGRFVETKNHKFIIDIFNEVHKKNSNSLLLLIGQGPLINEIKKKVIKMDLKKSVIFLGQRLDINELYQVFDVFILPSLYEGLPVVGIEAQACSLPCIFSSTITKSIKLLDTTKFLNISTSPTVWANYIVNNCKNINKHKTKKIISENGFNIVNEAKKLEKYYMSFYKLT